MIVDFLVAQMGAAPVVPVLTPTTAAAAQGVGAALARAGVRVVEVALRTTTALESIRAISTHPGLIVGAGTVLDIDQTHAAAEAGAQFIVSPGIDYDVISAALELGLVPIPGVATATEAMAARRRGLSVVKVFPAASVGGPGFIRALSAPLPGMRFMPSGGVDLVSMNDYLALSSVPAVSGSWMMPKRAIVDGLFDEIETATRAALVRASSMRVGEHS